jgi:catechol 2,3-dioxygenase-like lactoylglutathione lyase family enzyme
MTSTASAAAPLTATNQPAWAGVNHLALVTKDMDATVRFYDQVLGAPLVATIADDQMRHYFFRFGEHCTVAFFEYVGDDEPRFEKVAGVFDPRAVHFDHLALNLPGEEDLLALQKRLRDAGHEATEVIDHVAVRSIYFTDPNGIALEASWWVLDPTRVPVDHDGPLFSDPDPVPAVRELAGRRS